MTQAHTIMVTTLYGRDNKEPLVQIEMPNKKVQLRVDEVEDLARNLVHAAEASLTDAFVIEFFQKELDLEDKQVWALISSFREWREARIARPDAQHS